MSSLIKILLSILSFNEISSVSIPMITNTIKERILDEQNIEHHELESEPIYVIADPSNIIEKSTVENLTNGTFYKKNVDEFLDLETLDLKSAADFWYDSKLELNFQNFAERDMVGVVGGLNYASDNLEQETYKFNISLDERQEFKVINKEFSFHDEWTDVFIYTKLNLKFERVYGPELGIKITGTIEEELFNDSIVKYRNAGKVLGRELKGGIVLKKAKMNFISKKGDFEESHKKNSEMDVLTNIQDRGWLDYVQRNLTLNDIWLKENGINTKSVLVKTNYFEMGNDFNQNSKIINVRVEEKYSKKIIKNNINVKINFTKTTPKLNYFDIIFPNTMKNLSEVIEKNYYFLMNRFKLKREDIEFNEKSFENMDEIVNFKKGEKATFKYKAKISKEITKEFWISNIPQANRASENVKMMSWTKVKFNKFSKNYAVDDYAVTTQSKINDDELTFKDIISSKNSLDLLINKKDIIFIPNEEEFRNLKFKHSDNIQVKKVDKTKYEIFAISLGEGYVEFNSIDASERKRININVLNVINDFDVSQTEIEITKGDVGFIDLISKDTSDLVIINKNKNLFIDIENKKIKITGDQIGDYQFELYSQKGNKSIFINVKIIENNLEIIFDNQTSINLVNQEGKIKILNANEIELEKIEIISNDKNLSIFQIDDQITYFSQKEGSYEIQINYKNKKYVLNIYIFENYQYRVENLKLSKKIKFLKSNFNIIEYSPNLDLSEDDNYYIFESKLKLNPDSYINLISNTGENIQFNLYKNDLPPTPELEPTPEPEGNPKPESESTPKENIINPKPENNENNSEWEQEFEPEDENGNEELGNEDEQNLEEDLAEEQESAEKNGQSQKWYKWLAFALIPATFGIAAGIVILLKKSKKK